MHMPPFFPFNFVILHKEEETNDYLEWKHSCAIPPILVGGDRADIPLDELSVETVRAELYKLCEHMPGVIEAVRIESIKHALDSWVEPSPRTIGYQVGGHATVTPNLMALMQFGYDDLVYGEFRDINRGNQPYVDQIIRTSQSVMAERAQVEQGLNLRLFRKYPDLNLFAPSMYSHVETLVAPTTWPPSERRQFRNALNALHRQAGYNYTLRSEAQIQSIMGLPPGSAEHERARPNPHALLGLRARELSLATACVETLSASDLSATLRLPNAINRTRGQIRQFSEHYRSDERRTRKRLEAFRSVQDRLAAAVPGEFMDVIRSSKDGIRIISDINLEWLDLDGLPLMFRKDVSRIPTTPGNLFVGQIAGGRQVRLVPDDFRKVLILSALERHDPIQRMFEIAFEVFSREWKDNLQVEFAEVTSEEGLIDTLNAFEGAVVVFDGHGSHRPDEPAYLHLFGERCDVWNLSGRLDRPPPIVILSACDTHAADRNHATTANGFLSLGTCAVLASAFPLDARIAATFTARLMYRISTYIPAAIDTFGRALSWAEVVAGMLRMQLLTDFMRRLEGKQLISHDAYERVHQLGNMAINGMSEAPFEEVIEILAAENLDEKMLKHELDIAVATSSAISYINIGRPETIIISAETLAQ